MGVHTYSITGEDLQLWYDTISLTASKSLDVAMGYHQ